MRARGILAAAIVAAALVAAPRAALPEDDDGTGEDVAAPTAHFLVRLRVIHPLMATLTALVLAGVAGTATLGSPSPLLKRSAIAVVVTQLAQIACGVVNLVMLAPVPMQMLHLLFADLAWIALVVFSDRFLGAPVSARHAPLQDVGEADPRPGGR